MPRFERTATTVKISAAVASTAASSYLAVIGLNLAEPHPVPEVASVITVATVSLATTVRGAVFEAFGRKLGKQRRAVRQQMEAALLTVQRRTGIDLVDLNINLLLVESHWRWRHLAPFARAGWTARPEAFVRWTPGKGVIGECWETGTVVAKDLSALNHRLGTCTREQWEKRPVATRMGLTFDDWRKTRGKYDSIIAVPVNANGRFVGCIALDGPAHNSRWIDDREVRDALALAARTIAHTVHA